MVNQEPAKKSFITSLLNGYRFAALICLNTLIFLLVINIILFIIFRINDSFNRNIVFKKYNNLNVESLYPNMTRGEVDNLLKETWSRPCVYEPFTQFKERPYKGHYVNVDNNGFRYTKNQGPWPPRPENINIFLFGGSTTFGYGVSDDQTIASYLQEYLTTKTGADVRVYNFGRGFYYLTQERILYEQLLTSGFIPDIAIFIDGLNDFSSYKSEPYFTERLRELFPTDVMGRSIKFISVTPLGKAAEIINDKIRSLFPKEDIEQLNDLKSSSIADKISVDSIELDRVINRYLTDKKFIEATSNIFGVKPIFVWQPSPDYDYDKNYYPSAIGDTEENVYAKYGYKRMANLIKENPMGSNFIWCADIQKELKQPPYVDRVHYSASFSKILAEVIANQLMERFSLKKRSDQITAVHN
jgi:hypothetical protein